MDESSVTSWADWFRHVRPHAPFQNLKQKYHEALAQGRIIYPKGEAIFRALRLCPKEKVKVVILGQDPYHGPGQANGLAFSVNRGVSVPPSLQNIYKLMQQDLPHFVPPQHGDLTSWANQGVLLLNTILTVEAGKPQSHADWGWELLTDGLIQLLDSHPKPLVFMLWGRHARRKAAMIQRRYHLCLQSAHPSPLSAHRGFLTSGHFRQAQAFLESHGTPIQWQL